MPFTALVRPDGKALGPREGRRVFVAKFFDNNGNEATAEVDIEPACRRAKKLVDACGGKCTDLVTDADSCGASGNACSSNVGSRASAPSPSWPSRDAPHHADRMPPAGGVCMGA